MESSSFGRLIGVLVAPGKTFRSIAERPTWAVAFVVLLVLTVASVLLFFQRVDFVEVMRAQVEAQGQDPDQLPEGMEGFAKGCAMASAFGFPLAVFFIVPAVLLVFNLLGGQIGYKKSLAVSLHAMMPSAVAALLSIPVLLSRPSITMEEVEAQTVLKSNLAFLAAEEAPKALVALLASIDLFNIWMLVLFVIGYHVAAQVTKKTAALVVVGLWALLVLLRVGAAALGSLQGG